MKIVNKKVQECFDNGIPIGLNLGAGNSSEEGMYSLDCVDLEGIDIIADMNKPLSLIPDNSISKIITKHSLEHIQEFIPLLSEIHRILTKDATLDIWVPHFSNPYGFSDPTHVRFFGLYTMSYFVDMDKQPSSRKVPCFYTDLRFEIDSIKISFYGGRVTDRIMKILLIPLVNFNSWSQDFYERRLCRLYPASELHYKMRPVK